MSDAPPSTDETAILSTATTHVTLLSDNEHHPSPPASQMRKLVRVFSCNGCYDLNYDVFWQSTGFKYPPGGDANMRYRITSPERINAAAARGCRLCRILHQGIEYCRVELGQYTIDRTVRIGGDVKCDGEDEETDDEIESSAGGIDEVTGFNKVVSRRLKSTFHRSERKRECNIFLALRFNKQLTIERTFLGGDKSYWAFWEWNLWGQLQLYTETGYTPIHPAFGHASRVPSSLKLAQCTDFIKGRLEYCRSRHSSCLKPSTILPKRLVYVTDEIVRLVETESLAYSPYLTLSHCWGRIGKMIKTTKQNFNQRKANIDWEELPVVFRDALMVTKGLGHQWIWIDSLCIIQDDERDWQEQSSEMASVYSNSFLNIAATSSPDSHQGFFSDRKNFPGPPESCREISVESLKIEDGPTTTDTGLRVRFTHQPCHKITVGYARSSELSNRAAPLLQRAWVLQEILLAPRNIHFASSEMIWECNTSLDCECSGITDHTATRNEPKTRFSKAFQGKLSKKEILELWYDILKLYSELKLTKHSDRPHALAGIASHFSRILNSDYLAGIWSSDIMNGLMWSPIGYFAVRDPTIGPSWSWISRYEPQSSTARFVNRPIEPDDRLKLHISEMWLKNADADSSGRVPYSELVISGLVFHAKLEDHGHFKEFSMKSSYEPTTLIIGKTEGAWIRDCHDPYEKEQGPTDVLCLLAGTRPSSPTQIKGLVLQADRDAKETVYRRIGVTEWDFEEARSQGMFEYGEVRKLTIV